MFLASHAISLSSSILHIRSNYDRDKQLKISMICSDGMHVDDDCDIVSALAYLGNDTSLKMSF
ncbi:hypothetical protein TSUD_389230 [Trifolium subterraneum]|uniref:Uncharacterized protein n=1 Tax=Trifolium subterraneum TaxID=3900 RepID=A0A2Z6NZF5_TRISU|nr:hypothetical protein TSUD_389230 [Trifolium subterraneum]